MLRTVSNRILSRALIRWFEREARDLPWRRTRDPYAIWISEVMLQQTQVVTVVPYWQRWMKRFPTVGALADATLDDVLKYWEGLGYYSRARNLHRAAKVVVDHYGGKLPADRNQLLALPGIGRYTAGAICSIAFHQPEPVLDGNVTRVVARLFGIGTSVKLRRTTHRLWGIAQSLIEAVGPRPTSGRAVSANHSASYSTLNQALMELGATLCAPLRPECGRCPLRQSCVAHRMGRTDQIPNTGKRTPLAPRYFAAFVVCQGDRWLVRCRDKEGLNRFLWEFPNIELDQPAKPAAEMVEACLGFGVELGERWRCIRHTITRYRIQLDVYGATVRNSRARPTQPRGVWCSWAELEKLAFPSAHRKIAEGLRNGTNARQGTDAAASRQNRK